MWAQLICTCACIFVGSWLFHRFTVAVSKDTREVMAKLSTEEIIEATRSTKPTSRRLTALGIVQERSQGKRAAQAETKECFLALLDAVEADDTELADAGLAALARICRSDAIREALLAEPKLIERLLATVEKSLAAEKAVEDDDDDDEPSAERAAAEGVVAELQRKSMMLLGAIADGNVSTQSAVVDAGAIKHILDAMEWFALHRALQQWALWALFTISYEHPPNKLAVVQSGSLEQAIRAMRSHGAEMEIQRHGILLLFSCLRSDRTHDTFAMRAAALNAGMQGAVRDAVEKFGDDDRMINQMGKDILKTIDDDAF